jgi:hypothetical protein
MEIRIEPHTLKRARERGVSPEQIEDVLRTGELSPAYGGRSAKSKVYAYDDIWMGRRYDHQLVKVIYAVEGGLIVTVTVVASYGRWEGQI